MLAQPATVLLAFGANLVASLPSGPVNETELAAHGPLTERATIYEGRGTIYQQFGVAGSCGNVHQDSDMIVALGHNFMQHQYQSAWCGHRMKVTNFGSQDVNVGGKGNSVIVTVGDSCDGCGPYDVDFSVGAWNKLTNSAPWSTFDAVWFFCDGGAC